MTCEELRTAWQTFVEIYRNERRTSNNYVITAYKCVEQLGMETMLELMATVVAIKQNDGRFYPENRKFLDKIPKNQEAVNVTAGNPFIYVNPNLDSVHSAHLNQIISELRKEAGKKAS